MLKTSEDFEIELSKQKLFLLLLGCIGFVALGISFIINPTINNHSIYSNSPILFGVGTASVLFFGFIAIFNIRKIFDNKPGIVISKTGLTDNSSAAAAGEILWNDIEDISVIEIKRQKIIMIYVKNPTEYINKQPNSFKRGIMQLNFKMYGTPISISSNALKTNHKDLLTILKERLTISRI